MPSILIVEKTGTVKSLNVKVSSNDELYKKAGFKTNADFILRTTWNTEVGGKKYAISLYAKNTGIAKFENKYEFPPPVDNELYFGNCVLVHHVKDNTSQWKDLSVSEWEKIYDHLYGGFESLGTDDTESDESDDGDIPKTEEDLHFTKGIRSEDLHFTKGIRSEDLHFTKSGYLKDGFVVEDEDVESFEESSEEEVAKKKRKPVQKSKKTPSKKTTSSKKKNDGSSIIESVSEVTHVASSTKPKSTSKSIHTEDVDGNGDGDGDETVEDGEEYLGCTDELTEEEYLE